MPVISVVIPVYNGEKTIQTTIKSVLSQTFQDWELIIIDDGSQDKTLDIINKIQDPRIKIFSYPNAGLAASRNRGFSHSIGEFIAFLDADDLWTPDKLEAQLKALQDNPQAAVAYSWCDCIDESGKFLRTSSHSNANGDVYAKLLLTDFLDNGSNPLIRRQALAEVGEFDESLPAAEDWDMWLRLAARYHFISVPAPQILYRVSFTSMTTNVERQEVEMRKVIERAFSQAPKSLQYLKRYSLGNIYKYLTFKAIEGTPVRSRGIVAARFLWNAVSNDLSLLRRQVTWKVLLKITIVVLLPSQLIQTSLTKRKLLSNLDRLMLHNRLEPF